MIDARGLHEWLGNKDAFSNWIRDRMGKYGFEESIDFIGISQKTGGRPRKDYLLTIDTAKELSMVERTDIGRATRRYFIQMEKAALEMAEAHQVAGTAEQIPQSFYDAMERC